MKKLKILLITQGISRLVEPMLNSGHSIVGVLESMPRDWEEGVLEKPILYRFLKKIYDVAKRENHSLFDFCEKRKIPYNFICKNNNKSVSLWIKSIKPDLIVVYGMSQLLKDEILKIPPCGVINLHPSFLPSYRGPNPDFWQYYDVEMNPAATVHYLDAGEDTGDIIYQACINIPLGTKSPERLDILIGKIGIPLLLKAVNAIAQGCAPRTSQSLQSPTLRARNLNAEEHTQIIDWENWPIQRIWHILRGTETWLHAIQQPEGLFKGQQWSILDYLETDISQGKPGTLGVYRNRKCIFLKDGVIYIKVNFSLKKAILKILFNN